MRIHLKKSELVTLKMIFFYEFFQGFIILPIFDVFPRLLRQANRSVTTTSKVQRHTHTTLAPIARLISFLFSCSFRCWSLCLLAHQGLGTKNSKKKKSLKEPTIREAFNSNNSQHTSSVQTRNWERLNRFSHVFFFFFFISYFPVTTAGTTILREDNKPRMT